MDQHIVYKTHGVCAKAIEFDLVNGYVHNLVFVGGCKVRTPPKLRSQTGEIEHGFR